MRRFPCLLTGLAVFALSSLILPANAQTFSSSYTHRRQRTAARSASPATSTAAPRGCARQIGPRGADQRGRSARNRLGRPQPHVAARNRLLSLVRSVQFDRPYRRMAGGGRQAVRDHPALADRRQRRSRQERTTDGKTDAGRDTIAAGAGLPRRLYRRPGQPQSQRARPAAADEFARDFNCGKDEVKVIGERGRAVELARR